MLGSYRAHQHGACPASRGIGGRQSARNPAERRALGGCLPDCGSPAGSPAIHSAEAHPPRRRRRGGTPPTPSGRNGRGTGRPPRRRKHRGSPLLRPALLGAHLRARARPFRVGEDLRGEGPHLLHRLRPQDPPPPRPRDRVLRRHPPARRLREDARGEPAGAGPPRGPEAHLRGAGALEAGDHRHRRAGDERALPGAALLRRLRRRDALPPADRRASCCPATPPRASSSRAIASSRSTATASPTFAELHRSIVAASPNKELKLKVFRDSEQMRGRRSSPRRRSSPEAARHRRSRRRDRHRAEPPGRGRRASRGPTRPPTAPASAPSTS